MLDTIIEKIKDIFDTTNIYGIIIDKTISIIIVLLLAGVASKIFIKIIDYIAGTSLRANAKLGIETNNKRSDTLRNLIKSVCRYTIYFVAFIQILTICGVNTTGILASAGLVSVAIGFGAQSLVKDIITGFFIILENQFDVGDYVKINNQAAYIAEGHVLALGLRSTKIRANSGEIYFIPNSSINQVINYSQTYSLANVQLDILIEENIAKLDEEITSLLETLNIKEEYTKQFYKKEKLKLVEIANIKNNIATIKIQTKVKLTKNTLVETMIRKDFYNKFAERIQ